MAVLGACIFKNRTPGAKSYNAQMNANLTPWKAAPIRRVRGAGVGLCIRPIAFGNALGSALAGNIINNDIANKQTFGATFADDAAARRAQNPLTNQQNSFQYGSDEQAQDFARENARYSGAANSRDASASLSDSLGLPRLNSQIDRLSGIGDFGGQSGASRFGPDSLDGLQLAANNIGTPGTRSDAGGGGFGAGKIKGVIPYNQVTGLPNTVSSVDGFPSNNQYKIAGNFIIKDDGTVSHIPAFFTALNANTNQIDYVIGQSDLPQFVQNGFAYREAAYADNQPAYGKTSSSAAASLASGIVNLDASQIGQGFNLLAKSYGEAFTSPDYLLNTSLALTGSFLASEASLARAARFTSAGGTDSGTLIQKFASDSATIESNGATTSVVTRTVGQNTANYVVDAEGNTLSVSGTLAEDFRGGVRSSAEIQAQSNAAAAGIAGDQGGHLVGYRFLPEQGAINLFPQQGNFNMSAFKTLENDYARYIGKGYQVDFEHTLGNFDPITGRPGVVNVDFSVTDINGNTLDSFSQKFKNASGQTYTRRAQ
jgi:hypothetical protein